MAVGFVHEEMTRDALLGLCPKDQLEKFMKLSAEVDIHLPHGSGVGHRTGKYQKEFEKFGGKECPFPGAEEQTVIFLRKGNLGYALHFIQDALCPEHIFPFREDFWHLLFREPHMNFSLYVWLNYRKKWAETVRNAPIIQINSFDDLKNKIIGAADWVRQLPCDYLREDGEKIGKVPARNWRLSDENIGKILGSASGLIKGTYILVSK